MMQNDNDCNMSRRKMIMEIRELDFSIIELGLYLDVNPNNREALDKFNEYRNKTNELITQYERKYGPLMVNKSDINRSFNWIDKWPWVN